MADILFGPTTDPDDDVLRSVEWIVSGTPLDVATPRLTLLGLGPAVNRIH